jgi:hypothetical protein
MAPQMRKLFVSFAAILSVATVIFGVYTLRSRVQPEPARIMAQVAALRPELRQRVRACFDDPSPTNVERFRTSFLEMRRLVMMPEFPKKKREASELDLTEGFFLVHAILSKPNTIALRALLDGLFPWSADGDERRP